MSQPEISWKELRETTQVREAPARDLAERTVLGVLARLNRGGLTLRYPEGNTRFFGQAGHAVTAEITLRNPREFFARCVAYGGIGLGESYVDGDWDTPDIEAVVTWLIENIDKVEARGAASRRLWGINLLNTVNRVFHLGRANTPAMSKQNIAEHYDLGNEFYRIWLDPTMTYSAGKFAGPQTTLEEAQHAKYQALGEKLRLRPGDRVLEIGCGWGGFCCHAARNFGCHVTALTISKEQASFAWDRVRREGLEHLVEIRVQDYREVTGQFDKIASIEMLEAVGEKYLETFFGQCARLLTPEGILAMQFITVPDNRYENLRRGVDWIQKHIFPGSLLLSLARVNLALSRTGGLGLHELEDLGSGYTRTLSEWHQAFNARWDSVRVLGFDERFRRKWNYYLKYCEAAFRTRNISVVQAVYSRPNNPALHSDIFPRA